MNVKWQHKSQTRKFQEDNTYEKNSCFSHVPFSSRSACRMRSKNRGYYSCSRYHRSCFYIDDFNAANPDIQVVAHSIPANGERLTKLDILAMSGGDMDVMPISDGDQFTRFESGMLAPLDDFIAKDGVDMDKSFGKYARMTGH